MTNPKSFAIIYKYEKRDVAQLVARVLWEHDVAGSNPVIPTIGRGTGKCITPVPAFGGIAQLVRVLA